MDNLTPKQRRQKASQQRRTHNVMLAGIFLLILLVFAIINLCTKTKDFSESENRSLAKMPAFSLSSLADGSYFSGLTTAFNDQFFSRDGWISMKLREDSLLGRKESGGVYLCENGYLIAAPETPNDAALQNTAAAIQQFAAKYPDITMQTMLIPGASAILSDYLPKNAPVRDQRQDIANVIELIGNTVRHIDVSENLANHAEEYIYYKTDHHWTSLGARYAFEAAGGALGVQSAVTYDIFTVTTTFEGTLASKSGSHQQLDSIQIYAPEDTSLEYYVSYSDTQETACSMFQSACLEVKDKYTVFFGGNHPMLEVHTTANTGRSILIFKDSYANSFIQFLIPYYDNIILIDPRYYYDNVDLIMNNSRITDVLFLYSADTFLTDTALTDVLTAGTAQPQEEAISDPMTSTPAPSPTGSEPSSTEDTENAVTPQEGGTVPPPVPEETEPSTEEPIDPETPIT